MRREAIKEAVEEAPEKRKAILSMLGGKSLYKVSRAYSLFIPRLWLRLYGWEVDGRIWVNVKIDVDKITIKPMGKEQALSMMGVNDVAPDKA